MPRIVDQMENLTTGNSNFKFSAVNVGRLRQTEYTLATIAVDLSGSVEAFKKELENALQMMYAALKKSPRANNLMVRLIGFSSQFPDKGVCEIHGFKLLGEIHPDQIQLPRPAAGTPLFDAVLNGVEVSNAYAKELDKGDFLVNSVGVAITDGADNESFFKPKRIAEATKEGIREEYLESNLQILIGINPGAFANGYSAPTNGELLEKFKNEAGLDHYRSVEDATPNNLAKMAGFVSHSVSSQSQALGSGGKSQAIAPTI